jgi:hypothetical protein
MIGIDTPGHRLFSLCLLILSMIASEVVLADTVTTVIAMEGKSIWPVVISDGASKQTIEAASTLSEYLNKISGAEFRLKSGDGTEGIAVGIYSDFPSLSVGVRFEPEDMSKREEYLLRSHKGGIYVIGATELAVRHAVWDFLYRLGHRQFFPGQNWEIVPRKETLAISVDTVERPDYYTRRIWYSGGLWGYNEKPYKEWCAKNRVAKGIDLNTGHAYEKIIAANRDEFDAHPEYYALVGGKRSPTKFCISNSDLRKLIVSHALRHFERNVNADSISLDPSDGGGWCECASCKAIGSISDRVVLLANEVADAISKRFPGKLVGIYAYNFHSTPPQMRVHPNVVVSVATELRKGGLPLEEVIKGWAEKGAQIGIREYYGLAIWDWNLPVVPRKGEYRNPEYVARTIPYFYSKGSRFFTAESAETWGSKGLVYYLASRMLWSVEESGNSRELIEDFLEKCFGPAKEIMREFFGIVSGKPNRDIDREMVDRMYRILNEAKHTTEDDKIRSRLEDLVKYTRYAGLAYLFRSARGAKKAEAFEEAVRYAVAIRESMMVHAKGLCLRSEECRKKYRLQTKAERRAIMGF